MKKNLSGSLFFLSSLSLAVAIALRAPAGAATFNWKASTTGDWSVAANWVEISVPTNGDDAVITNAGASAILSSASSNLSSLILSRTLIFTNWDTILTATNVTILSNGVVTLPSAFTNGGMSNNVYIICSNLTIAANGSINADGRGYLSSNGPGCKVTTTAYAGASYGGRGGLYAQVVPSGYAVGNTYGSADAPLYPGSGGAKSFGGNGGGAIRIEATGIVTNNGAISANGTTAGSGDGGGGSGGAIYITCRTFAGTNGIIRANGGNGGAIWGGAGGGGRIAVVYNTAAQSNEPPPSVTFSTLPGSATYPGDIGTLYFPDNQFLTNPISHSGQWMVPGFTNWSVANLTIANASIGFPEDGFLLDVTGDLTITGATGRLYLGSNSNFYDGVVYAGGATSVPTLRVGGNLILTNGARLHIFSGYTNDATLYGARADVAGDIIVAGGSSLLPYSQHNTGASPLFTARNVTVMAGGTINASALGYRYWEGPGKGAGSTRAAGHGGIGGGGGSGSTYGYSNAPTQPGSGGGNSSPSQYPNVAMGGGLVRIEAQSVKVDGRIAADGAAGAGGGASGGGIFIVCNRFEGAGTNSANGGGGGGEGGGGGGRIAIWYGVRNIPALREKLASDPTYIDQPVAGLPLFTGTNTVTGGSGGWGNGANGTVMFIQVASPGTLFTIL